MELDESVFADDAFDCYAWLEEAVIDREGHVPALVPLVPQLTLLSQSLTKSIHATLHQLTVAGPQLQAQLDAMQRVTAPLASQLDSVAASVSLSSHASSSAVGAATTGAVVARRKEQETELQHLLTLHEAKERLQACSKALVEAARWEKNVRACAASIDGALADSTDGVKPNGASLAQRVREMHQSLEILKDMPGADDRKRTMERLSTQIEVAIKPKLDECLQTAQLPVARVQFCREVLASVGRVDHVVQAYCRVRPAQIHRVWYSYSAGESGAFGVWLDGFYGDMLRLMQRETEHAVEIFGSESHGVLVTLLENTLLALKDSFRDRLKKDFTVQELLRAYQASCSFLSQVAKVLRSSDTIVANQDADEFELVANGLASELRAVDRDTAERILVAVLAPYQSFFTNYTQFASEWLSRRLTALVPTFSVASANASTEKNDEDDDDAFEAAAVEANKLETYAQQVEDVSSELWKAVEESVRLCYEFSAGAAFPEAVHVISQAVDQLTQRLVSAIPAIRSHIGVDSVAKTGALNHGLLMADWGRFHSALALLRACGTIESDLATVEKRLCVLMREQAQRLYGGAASGSSDDTLHAHKTSPKMKRKEFQRRQSGVLSLSLSALVSEPSRITPAIVMKWLKEEPDREKALNAFVQDLLQDSADEDNKMFTPVHLSLSRYRRQVQTLVYDSVFAPIVQVLRNVPTNECWAKAPDANLSDLPTFSTLPQEYITMVADLLLSLLPQLEPFAESSSLQKAAVASTDAYNVCSREWAALGQSLRLSSQEIKQCERIFELLPPPEDEDSSEGAVDTGIPNAATFVDIWTSAVASGTTAALLTAVVKIPSLSALGAKQLEADIGYFQNVLNALSGGSSERNFLIVGLQKALQIPEAELATASSKHSTASSDVDDELELHVVQRLRESLVAKRLAPANQPTSSGGPGSLTSSSSSSQLF